MGDLSAEALLTLLSVGTLASCAGVTPVLVHI